MLDRPLAAPRLRALAVVSTLALIATAGCDRWLTTPSQYARLQLITRTRTGDPVPTGLPLVLYTGDRPMAYASTDTSGRFLFTRVPPGNYGIRIQRPLGFKDFVTPNDSAASWRDGLRIGAGATDTVTLVLSSCVGTLRATVVDENGAPVPNAPVVSYISTQNIMSSTTGTDGVVVLPGAPCVLDLGIRLDGSAAYTVTTGKGSSFYDGFHVTNGQTLDFVFHVRRQP